MSFYHYALSILFPVRLSIDYLINVSSIAGNVQSIISIIFLVLLFYIFIRSNNYLVRFGLLFYFITYMPVSNIVPIVNTINDRYMYLPMAGFCMATAGVFSTINMNRFLNIKITVLLAGLLIISYSIITLNRNNVYYDSLSLYKEAVKLAPDNIRVQFNYSLAHLVNGDFKEAKEGFDKVRMLNPLYKISDVWYLKGVCFQGLSDPAMAKKYFEKILLTNPTFDALINYSDIIAKEGNIKGAIWLLKTGNEMFNEPELYSRMGALYAEERNSVKVKQHSKITLQPH